MPNYIEHINEHLRQYKLCMELTKLLEKTTKITDHEIHVLLPTHIWSSAITN